MTPMLATPEAIKSADVLGKLMRDYGPAGAASFTEAQASTVMMEGRAATYIDALAWVGLAADPAKSKVKDRVGYALPPGVPRDVPTDRRSRLSGPRGSEQREVSWDSSAGPRRRTSWEGLPRRRRTPP